jgi:hypothetical protein
VKSNGITFKEELIGYEPYFSYSYKLLSGLPARDYVGTVAVTEVDDERTMISWDVNYRYRFPFSWSCCKTPRQASTTKVSGGAEKEFRA